MSGPEVYRFYLLFFAVRNGGVLGAGFRSRWLVIGGLTGGLLAIAWCGGAPGWGFVSSLDQVRIVNFLSSLAFGMDFSLSTRITNRNEYAWGWGFLISMCLIVNYVTMLIFRVNSYILIS